MASLFLLAIAPGLAIAFFIYLKDRLDREPLWLLARAFGFGMLSTAVALLLGWSAQQAGLSVSTEGLIGEVAVYALFVGFSEEISKYLFLYFFGYKHREFNEPFDGITYGVMVAMGFATLENVLYVLFDEQGQGLQVGLLRMFTAVPAHAAFGVLMGYFVGLAKFRGGRASVLHLTGIGVAALFHAFYDFCLMANAWPGLVLGALVALGVGIGLSFRAMRLHRAISPFHPTVPDPPQPEERTY